MAVKILILILLSAFTLSGSSEVSVILKAIYFKVNSRPLIDLPRNQKILRLANRSCIFNELNAVDDEKIIKYDDEINWKGDRTLKIIEAIWYSAPLCVDFFDEQAEKYFEELKTALKSDFYVENLDCFKFGLSKEIPANVQHPLLLNFANKTLNLNITECENLLTDFFHRFLSQQIEGLKIEHKVLKIHKCKENFYIQKDEKKINLLKVAIIANTNERVPVKFLKITKSEFRESMKKQGKIMKDCLLKDIMTNRRKS